MNDQIERQITPVVSANGKEIIPEFLLRKDRKESASEVFQSAEDVGTEDSCDVK